MGCSASSAQTLSNATQKLQMSGTICGTTTLRAGGQMVTIEYAAQTQAARGKNQDRFFAVAQGSSALICGVCDGHSVHNNKDGIQHAEDAASHLANDLWLRLRDPLGQRAVQSSAGDVKIDAVTEAARECYLAHQKKCDAKYRVEIADRLIAEKQKIEAEYGTTLKLELPQQGGTTASALAIQADGIVVTWVGDSRVVLAEDSLDGRGALRTEALTTDHNTADQSERERLVASGGSTGLDELMAHVFVDEAEGSLKVTRSLGDSPFHKGDAVSAVPGVRHVPLTGRVRFVVVASDGIWDHLSNEQVVSVVAEALDKAEADGAKAACAAVLDHITARQASGELASHVDDRAIAVVVFKDVNLSAL